VPADEPRQRPMNARRPRPGEPESCVTARAETSKCHVCEIDHGDIAVGQPGTRRSRKINMSRELRPCNLGQFSFATTTGWSLDHVLRSGSPAEREMNAVVGCWWCHLVGGLAALHCLCGVQFRVQMLEDASAV
jgi:hypothetical protein